MSLERFSGWTALVTGASSGIGLETARLLSSVVGRLIVVARRKERLDALARDVARAGLEVEVIEADLSDPAALESVAGRARAADVDLLVNNAGLGDIALFERSEHDKNEHMIAVNVRALTTLSHALVSAMVGRRRGAILNVSSTAAFQPLPLYAVYGATKAYVSMFSEALRAELRGTGVSVTHLCPGPVDTEFFDVAGGRASMGEPPMALFKSAAAVAGAGLHGLARDRARVVPGLVWWWLILMSEVTPTWVFRVVFGLGRRMLQRMRSGARLR